MLFIHGLNFKNFHGSVDEKSGGKKDGKKQLNFKYDDENFSISRVIPTFLIQ